MQGLYRSLWCSTDVWVVDNGYSNNMCGMKEMLKELDESHKIQVKLGDNNEKN